MIDLDTAIGRIAQLDTEQHEALVRELDEAIAACGAGWADDEMQTVISVASAARILLRKRQAAAAQDRAMAIVRQLVAMETAE